MTGAGVGAKMVGWVSSSAKAMAGEVVSPLAPMAAGAKAMGNLTRNAISDAHFLDDAQITRERNPGHLGSAPSSQLGVGSTLPDDSSYLYLWPHEH
eukprot:1194745-Prorocentrum_minimum.AAC.7